jgi:hypothetical protein
VAALCFWSYWRHARGNPHAIIDLGVFRIPTFNVATIGGGFMRISVGAVPFLLAMLLQVGFGMSAFAAGMMTFISSAGALIMKMVAPPILRRFGFRAVLLVNGVISSASFLTYALLTPTMGRWMIMCLLGAGGFFRSLQFTALNGLAYADIDQPNMSRASTTSSMCQQLVQSVGVGLAASMLHFIQLARGEERLTWQAVSPAFLVVGLVSFVSLAWFVGLRQDAGEELSGRRRA